MTHFFSSNILQLRKNKGLNQTKLASILNLKRNTLSNYETRHTEPDISTIINFAKFFGISLDDLILSDLSRTHLNQKTIEKKNHEKTHLKTHLSAHLKDKTPSKINLGGFEAPPVYYFPYISGFLCSVSSIKSGVFTDLSSYTHPGLPPGLHVELPIVNSMMSPTIETGSKVVATLLSEPLKIISGAVYLTIDHQQEVSCNRLYLEDNNTVLITSDNPKFPPFKRPLNDFETLFKVVEVRSTLLDPPLTDIQRKIADLERKIADLEGDFDEE